MRPTGGYKPYHNHYVTYVCANSNNKSKEKQKPQEFLVKRLKVSNISRSKPHYGVEK